VSTADSDELSTIEREELYEKNEDAFSFGAWSSLLTPIHFARVSGSHRGSARLHARDLTFVRLSMSPAWITEMWTASERAQPSLLQEHRTSVGARVSDRLLQKTAHVGRTHD